MGFKIRGAWALALLTACSVVSDFDFEQADGGAPYDGTLSDVVANDSGDAFLETPDVVVPEGDVPSLPLFLTSLQIVADGEQVVFDERFSRDTRTYEDAEVGFFVREVLLTAIPEVNEAILTVNGVAINSGDATPIELGFGDTTLVIELRRGADFGSYSLTFDRGDSLGSGEYMKSVPVESGAGFGGTVAMAGELLVIGAPEEGAAYIFERTGTEWTQAARVEGSFLSTRFGASVATDGVLVAVGAPGETVGLESSGAAYIFRDEANWGAHERVTPSLPTEQGRFGSAVAIDGSRLAVGAIGLNAVYTYDLDGTTWSPRPASIEPPEDMSSNSGFGSALVMRGDTLVIAAKTESSGVQGEFGGVTPVLEGTVSGSGAVLVYSRSGLDWIDPISFKAFGPEATDGFGSAIAFDGTLLAVGAPGEDSRTSGVRAEDGPDSDILESGAVYTFRRDVAGGWSAESYIKAEVPRDSAGFGSSVTLWGNLLVVGAPNAVGGVGSSGAVALYVRTGGWSYYEPDAAEPNFLLPAADASLGDSFGMSIAMSGFGIVVGADGEDGGGSNAGAAYSFKAQ